MAAQAETAKGEETRARIVGAAAALIAQRGADGTSLSDIRTSAGVSSSQLYHYFGDKHGLIQAVVDQQSTAVVGSQVALLNAVERWEDVERWADALVASIEPRAGRGGCPVGTLAAGLADTDETARLRLEAALETWADGIATALRRLQENHLLHPDADIQALSTTTLATLQGGLLLAKAARDTGRLRIALDGAIAYLRSAGRP